MPNTDYSYLKNLDKHHKVAYLNLDTVYTVLSEYFDKLTNLEISEIHNDYTLLCKNFKERAGFPLEKSLIMSDLLFFWEII